MWEFRHVRLFSLGPIMRNEFSNPKAVLGGQLTVVDDYYRRAIELLETGAERSSGDGWSDSLLAVSEARRRFHELAELFPNSPHHLDWVAECDLALSCIHQQLGQQAEAEEKAQHAKELRSGSVLRRWKSASPLCREYENAKSLNEAARRTRDRVEALTGYQEGSRIGEQLVSAFPECNAYRDWLAANKGGSAIQLSDLGQYAEAKADFAASIQLRRKLVDVGWRPELVKCKQANTVFAHLRSLSLAGTQGQRQRRFGQTLACCRLYREVLSKRFGMDYVNRYLEALDQLLELAASESERKCVDDEIELAQSITNAATLDPHTEYLAAKLNADRRLKLRRQGAGICLSHAFQLTLCILLFLFAGMASFPLFCVVAFPCALFVRLIGTAQKQFAMGKIRDASICVMTFSAGLFGEHHGFLAAGCCLGLAVYAAISWGFRGELRWKHSNRILASCARISRRTDEIADRWALWIETHGTPWLKAFLLEADNGMGVPKLRHPFYWAATCCAVSYEFQSICLGLIAYLDELILPPARGPKPLVKRPRQNQSTSWAVLLRRPLHLARGDDVPLRALCA